jgi:hypothetical protein
MSTTPGRQTVVTINQPATIPNQGALKQDLSLDQISAGKQSTNGAGSFPGSTATPPNGNYQVSFTSKIGWRIQQFQETLSAVHELTTTDVQDVDPSGWAQTNGNTGWFSAYAHRAPSELPGIGAYTAAAGPNDKYFHRLVNAADTVAVANSADQTAFPPANATGVDAPLYALDRVYTGKTNHNPDEDIYYRFFVLPNSPFAAKQILDQIYFSNVPTYLKSDPKPGTGAYALTLFADGTAILQECTSLPSGSPPAATWVIRSRFTWCDPQVIVGHMHVVRISSDAHLDQNGQWQGSVIQFSFDNMGGSTSFGGIVEQWRELAIANLAPSAPKTYQITQIQPVQPTLQPLRLDVRRDIFLTARIQKAFYRQYGYLRCKRLEAPLYARDTPANPTLCPLIITVYGPRPSDSSFQCNIYEETSGLQLPIQSTTVTPAYVQFKFTCPRTDAVNERYFNTVITLNASSDQTKSPTVNRVTWQRQALGKLSTPTPLEIPIVSHISMSGPDKDFTHETMSFTAPDPLGVLDSTLGVQAGQTVTVDCFYDSAHPTKFSRFFQGRMVSAKRIQRGSSANITGYPKWARYQGTAVGEWSTLAKLTTTTVRNYAAANDGVLAGWKVTDAIRDILSEHYLSTQIDVPDINIRFFVESNSANQFQIESYTPIGHLIAQWARDYLGAYFVWDANYTNGGGSSDTNGCWRLLVPPSPGADISDGIPGYNYVCQFLSDRYPGTKGIPAENPYAWPTITAYNPDGSDMVQTFCRKFTTSTQIIPPAGNKLIVTGIGVAPSSDSGSSTLAASGGDARVKLTCIVHNWKAADFGQNNVSDGHPLPDPTHPDYTDGIPQLIYYCDPALRTAQAVQFVARRIYDMSMHSQEFVILEAPFKLIYPKAGDTKWIRPRPMRFGDPVLFNGVPYFIWSAPSGAWGEGHDQNQMAAYELRRIPSLTASYSASGKDEQWKGICSEVS